MRVKINGKDLNPGDRVTIESSNYSDGQALTIVTVGFVLIYLIAKGGLFA